MLVVLNTALASAFFFFQAEDGIRDKLVTGVQTCALPILTPGTSDWLRQATPTEVSPAVRPWVRAEPSPTVRSRAPTLCSGRPAKSRMERSRPPDCSSLERTPAQPAP